MKIHDVAAGVVPRPSWLDEEGLAEERLEDLEGENAADAVRVPIAAVELKPGREPLTDRMSEQDASLERVRKLDRKPDLTFELERVRQRPVVIDGLVGVGVWPGAEARATGSETGDARNVAAQSRFRHRRFSAPARLIGAEQESQLVVAAPGLRNRGQNEVTGPRHRILQRVPCHRTLT